MAELGTCREAKKESQAFKSPIEYISAFATLTSIAS